MKKIKSWCRYWHFNIAEVLSDNDGHRNYLDVVGLLDEWNNTRTWGDDGMADLDSSWKVVLSNLNNCTEDQLKELDPKCTSAK